MAMYKSESVDVDLEIEVSDVIEFIEDHASEKELEEIRKVVIGGSCRSLDEKMKDELLEVAARKYTLVELEQRLGTKFDLA